MRANFSLRMLLLASAVFGVAEQSAASAQTASSAVQAPNGKTSNGKVANGNASKMGKPVQPEMVTIVGQGSTRQIQTLTSKQFSQAAPGTNPLKVIGQLPGVSFNSTDPLAIDVYSANIYVHGFSQDQLGFTLDGIPLGAQGYGSSGQGYGNIGGINVNSAIASENIERVNVSQGAGAVDVASSSNLGGVMQFYSVDPADKTGGKISQAFGSNSTYRTFIRLDSGTLNATGTKFFVSYDRAQEDKWKGSGQQFLEQVNAKAVQPLGDFGTLSAFFDWDHEAEATYSDLSKDILSKLGSRVDYYYPNYAAAYHAAEGSYPAGYQKLDDPLDASYYDGPSKAVNYLAALKLDTNLTDHLQWNSTIYGHGKDFAGYYTSPYYPSPNGAPLSEEEFAADTQRYGLTSDLIYTLAKHKIDAGIWYEAMHAYVPERLYSEPVLGEGTPVDPLGTLPKPFATPWAYTYNDDTFQAHLQDTYELTSYLHLNVGFRSLFFTGRSKISANDVAYTEDADIPSGALSADNAFLPQFSINWKIAPHQEAFFDFSENIRSFPQSGFSEGSPWGVTSTAAFSALQKNLQPERDFVYEVGYRYTSRPIIGLLTLYHSDFSNRLQAIAVGPLADIQSTIANVGSVEMYGLDASVILRPARGLSVSNNISLNSSRYQSDLVSDGVSYNLKDKQEVNYPEFMYKSSMAYTFGSATAHLDASYMGKRYISYNNDTSVPGYWLTNAGVSYRIDCHCYASAVTLGLNIYNLMNTRYISITGETGNPLSGDYQTFQIGSPRAFYGTIAADF